MALTHVYTILCDEVRVENNGKFIILGVYTPNILVPQIPFLLSSLTFFQAFNSDRAGHFPFRSRLQHLETGRDLSHAMGVIQMAQPGMVVSAIRFGNITLDRVGSYNYLMNIDGQADPIVHNFEVVLQVVQPQA